MRFCRYSRLRNKLDCRHLLVILNWNITDEPLALRCHHDDSIFLIMRVCVYYHLARPQVGGCLPSSTEHFALSLMLLFVSGTKASSLDGPPFDYSMPNSKHHTCFLPVPTLWGLPTPTSHLVWDVMISCTHLIQLPPLLTICTFLISCLWPVNHKPFII